MQHHEHASDAGHGPVVTMDRAAAQELAIAIDAARVEFVERIASISRRRTLTDGAKANGVNYYRGVLRTLEAFHEAHCKAHGIGGY